VYFLEIAQGVYHHKPPLFDVSNASIDVLEMPNLKAVFARMVVGSKLALVHRLMVQWLTAQGLTLLFCVAFCSAVLIVAVLIYGPGEHLWFTTLILFGPAWLWLVGFGVAVLSWGAFHRGRRLGLLLLFCGFVLLFPVLYLSLPWRNLLPVDSKAPRLRVATWNMAGRQLEQDVFTQLVNEYQVDLVLMEECGGVVKVTDLHDFQAYASNRMCAMSRFPIAEIAARDRMDVYKASGSGAIVRYTITPPWGQFAVTNVHLETPREGFEDFVGHAFLDGIATLTAKNKQRYVEAQLAFEWTQPAAALPRLIAGDFNTSPQSDLLRNTWKGYANCFGVAGLGFGHSKHTRLLGVRIDHILASEQWTCTSSQVLRGFHSDHDPVLAELALTSVAP
jgi:vancomycin resistance protein VanJ